MNTIYRRLVILFIGLMCFTSCKRKYTIEGDKVFYEYWNEGSGQNRRLLEMADSKTFQPIEFDCDCDFKFGKDRNHLYIDGKPINNIDPYSFTFIGNYVFRDKDSAYFFGFYNNLNECSIKGINPDRLKLIKYPWSKADNILIYGNDTILLQDINDFIPIDKYWGKTKKHVINENKIINQADPKSFEVINSYSGKDSKHTYEFGKIKK